MMFILQSDFTFGSYQELNNVFSSKEIALKYRKMDKYDIREVQKVRKNCTL